MRRKRLLKFFLRRNNSKENYTELPYHLKPKVKKIKLLIPKQQIIKSLIVLSSGIVIFLILFAVGNLLQIKSIELIAENKINLIGLNNYMNQNILFINEKKLTADLLRKNSNIKIILVQKVFPDKIKIYYKNIEPIAQFKINEGYLVLSSEGQIVKKTKSIDRTLTQINYYQQYDYGLFHPGEKLEFKDIVYAIGFIKSSLDLGLKPDTLDIKDINMITSNINGKMIIFSAEKDLTTITNEFTAIMKKFKIEGRDFKVLDLRFDKPIVKF